MIGGMSRWVCQKRNFSDVIGFVETIEDAIAVLEGDNFAHVRNVDIARMSSDAGFPGFRKCVPVSIGKSPAFGNRIGNVFRQPRERRRVQPNTWHPSRHDSSGRARTGRATPAYHPATRQSTDGWSALQSCRDINMQTGGRTDAISRSEEGPRGCRQL